jgi:hypothetical protein
MQNENESRKANSAEAQTKTSAQAKADFSGLQQTIVYLKEREANLEKYSDKLREQLQQIFEPYGSPFYCRTCGEYISPDHEAVRGHKPNPHIYVSISPLPDTEIFYVEPEERDNGVCWLELDGADGLNIVSGYELGAGKWTCKPKGNRGWTPNREVLKALVQSGRLPKFLAHAAKILAEAEAEYQQVADIAEKMAKVLE